MRLATQAYNPLPLNTPTVIEPGFLRGWRRFGKWRRRADSNRCIKVLQTSPLATWVRRHAHQQQNLEFRIGRASRESRIFENVLDQSRLGASFLNSTALLQAPIPWTSGILERETGFEPATSTLAIVFGLLIRRKLMISRTQVREKSGKILALPHPRRTQILISEW